MSNLYELTQTGEGFQFTNSLGDKYTVYMTEYYLLHPYINTKTKHVKVYMLGFSSERVDINTPRVHDSKTKRTILSVFEKFAESFPESAFVYVCDNSDGLARNRRITFGSWFNEINGDYQQIQSHISYNDSDWYSCLMIKSSALDKQLLIDAYTFTLKQLS